MVRDAVRALVERSDVVVLAQASMARVLAVIPEDAPRGSDPVQSALGAGAGTSPAGVTRANGDLGSLCQSQAKSQSKRPAFAALARLGFDTLILTRRVNFAWITAGGRAIACYGEPTSPVHLVLTPHGKYAVGYSIDMLRTADEELAGLGYEIVSLPSFGKTMLDAAGELAVGRVAADGPSPAPTTSARRSASCTSPTRRRRWRATQKLPGPAAGSSVSWRIGCSPA